MIKRTTSDELVCGVEKEYLQKTLCR